MLKTTISASLSAITSLGGIARGHLEPELRNKVDELKEEYGLDYTKRGSYHRGLKEQALINTKGSITKLLKQTVITPTIIVTKDAYNSSAIDKAIDKDVTTFAGFYLQAFQIMTGIYGMDAISAIDMLSTGQYTEKHFVNTTIDKVVSTLDLSLEDNTRYVNTGKPITLKNFDLNRAELVIGLNNEADSEGDKEVSNNEINANVVKSEKNSMTRRDEIIENILGSRDDIQKTINNAFTNDRNNRREDEKDSEFRRAGNESKVINTSMKDEINNDKSAAYNYLTRDLVIRIPEPQTRSFLEIPIHIRANVLVIPVEEIYNVIDSKNYRKSFWYRMNEWRAGAISTKDLIFCGDLIREYKKARLSPNSKLIAQITEMATNNTMRRALTNYRGYEESYNMIIVSEEERLQLNKILRGDVLTSGNVRDKFLTALQAFSITVLDDTHERIISGLRDIKGVIDIGYRKLDKFNNSGKDMLDIIKAFSTNNLPRF